MEKFDDFDLLHLFHQCGHWLHMYRKSYGQTRILIQLLEKGTLTQRELIDITKRRSATLSEQLESMDKAGYITRTRNEQDRRNVDISLTPLGEAEARKGINDRNRRAHALFSVLTQEEKTQLYQLLEKLKSAWKNIPIESEAAPI